MKKSFVTGLIILLPLALTLMIADFILNFLTTPFLGIAKYSIEFLGIYLHPQVQLILSRFIILLALFGFTLLLGKLGEWVFIHYLIRAGDFILQRIPFVRTIYRTSKEVITTIFSTDKKAFKEVVLIPFPTKSSLCVGLVTREHFYSQDGLERIAVFIPSTPHMTAGFLVMIKKEDVRHLDMKIEDAVKFVISGGITTNS